MLAADRTIEMDARDLISGMRLASIAVVINYIALFLMIARFWDYEIFVVPLVIPVLTALTAKTLRNRERSAVRGIVLGSWLILAIVLVAIRSGKVVAWLASYHERDPQPLQDFIAKNVPIDSRVFGPGELLLLRSAVSRFALSFRAAHNSSGALVVNTITVSIGGNN